MKYDIENLASYPMDVATLAGPAILQAGGKLLGVELDEASRIVLDYSPVIRMTPSAEPKESMPAPAAEKTAPHGTAAAPAAAKAAETRNATKTAKKG